MGQPGAQWTHDGPILAQRRRLHCPPLLLQLGSKRSRFSQDCAAPLFLGGISTLKPESHSLWKQLLPQVSPQARGTGESGAQPERARSPTRDQGLGVEVQFPQPLAGAGPHPCFAATFILCAPALHPRVTVGSAAMATGGRRRAERRAAGTGGWPAPNSRSCLGLLQLQSGR